MKHTQIAAIVLTTVFGMTSLMGGTFKDFKEADKAGQAAYKAKDYKKMRAVYAEAKTLSKNENQEWNAVFYETRACREMKQYDDALVILDKYLAKNPSASYKGGAQFIKGLVLSAKNKNSEAIKQYEAAVSIPSLAGYQREQSYRQMIAIYYDMKQYDKSEKICRTMLSAKKNSYHVDAYYYLGQCAYAQGKYSDAEKAYLEGLKIVSLNKYYIPLFNFQLGYTYLKLNKQAEAAKYFEATVKAAPNSWRGKEAAQCLKKLKK